MRKLTTEQRAAILTALVEGNSIASTCRMLRVNKITVLRLLADAGALAADYHDLMVRDLAPRCVQMDEAWSYVGAKQANVTTENCDKGYGDAWVWISIDPDSKLVINWAVGGRDNMTGFAFVADLADRLAERTQLTSDGLGVYRQAVQKAFKGDVDYGQIIKEYKAPQQAVVRYSPSVCIGCSRKALLGNPNPSDISTSIIERQNLTVRMSMRRFTRLTNAFSKRLENHKHAVALHYFNYNFIRKHMTIKTTPAVMAGVADKVWTMVDFVELMEREERLLGGGRLTNYKAAASKKRDDDFPRLAR
jgi:IS1 family transposase